MDLSIVIPVWNECGKISRDIQDAADFLNQQQLQGEIIVSDDGSTDRTDTAARTILRTLNIPFKVIKHEHHGKGWAVREGMNASKGKIVLFLDSGSCIPYTDIQAGIARVQAGDCDIAHGSRYLPASQILRSQPVSRRFCSAVFRFLMKRLFRLPACITDTQCGLKIYRGDLARQLYAESRIPGFLFDIEILRFALARHAEIQEFPIRWKADPDSRLSLQSALPRIFRDVFMLARHHASAGSQVPK